MQYDKLTFGARFLTIAPALMLIMKHQQESCTSLLLLLIMFNDIQLSIKESLFSGIMMM